MIRAKHKQHILLLLVLLLIPIVVGCGNIVPTNVMTVLAGSELKDIEPLLPQIAEHTGINLQFSYTGTLDGAEEIMSGKPVDFAWFSHAKYLSLLQAQSGNVAAQEKIMLSPVVMGVKESKAREWGWLDNTNLTWQDIANKVASGELRYAMTNPASSNSGFTALVGVASALSGSSDALQVNNINNDALQQFFKGQQLTAGSSGWLAESYIREQHTLDGMINYESVLLQLNASGQLQEPFTLIYPKEGIITADYPFMLINKERREAYDTLVAYLRSPEFQHAMMTQTQRRPVIAEVPLASFFPTHMLIELPFPNDTTVIDTLLFSYLDKQRIPSHAFFVLDVSGSMEGDGIDNLRHSLINLTGLDESLTGQFARFRDRERISLIVFHSYVEDVKSFQIEDTNKESTSMQDIRTYVDALQAGGGTAIYSSLQQAYTLAQQAYEQDPERYYSVVLMSDGANTEGISEQEFLDYYHALPPHIQAIKTFPILFGDADDRSMNTIAEATGGRVFDAKTTSLSSIFKTIRGYQ